MHRAVSYPLDARLRDSVTPIGRRLPHREGNTRSIDMRITTGIQGLDYILRGGLLAGRSYLVHGEPGTGKTTLGLHFVSADKDGLIVTFGQSADQIRADAGALSLNLDTTKILDLTPPPEVFSEIQTYDIFSPVEVERAPISQQISEAIDELNPQRIFVDSFGHFRNLTGDAFQHRRLAQSFFRFATRRGATLIVGSEDRECARDVDGVIQLESSQDGRTIRVTKFRGSDFLPGAHPMRLTDTGLQVPQTAA
jgi:circadian clock protein KaiC